MKLWVFVLLCVLPAPSNAIGNASPVLESTGLSIPATRTMFESENQSPPDEVDVPESQADKNEKMKAAATALAEVIGTLVGVASGPIGTAIAVGISVVSYFVELFKESNDDIWKKLEDKVEIKIGEKLAEYHLERLYTEVFRVLERRVRDPKKFDADDLDAILDRGLMVFPQDYKSLGWSYDLPLAILNWMPFMIAGYQHMIKKNAQPTCALANEMARVRAKVIAGMKEMTRKRYRTVHGTSYTSKSAQYDCKKKKSKKSLKRILKYQDWSAEEGVHCVSEDRYLTYDVGAAGKSFTVQKRGKKWAEKSWDGEINKIRDETVDFLWKEVVEKINRYFDPKICLENLGCKCPSKITKDEINFSYPKSCFGDSKCMHPCGRFGYDYDWCYEKTDNDDWIYCNRIDWNQCMPIDTTKVNLPNVLGDSKAKSKRTKERNTVEHESESTVEENEENEDPDEEMGKQIKEN